MDFKDSFNKAAAAAVFEKSAYEPSQLENSDSVMPEDAAQTEGSAPDLPEIVFSGKSNVGKSSMINRLVARKGLARVSSTPGKTASVNFYGCGIFRLVDLPGYGYAKVSKQEQSHWSELVEGYFNAGRSIALIVQMIDARHAPSQGDLQMIEYLRQTGFPFVIAFTKADKLKKSELEARKSAFPSETGVDESRLIYTSSETALGFDELKAIILKSIDKQA